MLSAIIKLLAFIASYFSNKQLINAGKQEGFNDVSQKEQEAEQQAKNVVIDTSTLSDAELAAKLQRWKRTDQ